jgi:hypothetical protein
MEMQLACAPQMFKPLRTETAADCLPLVQTNGFDVDDLQAMG